MMFDGGPGSQYPVEFGDLKKLYKEYCEDSRRKTPQLNETAKDASCITSYIVNRILTLTNSDHAAQVFQPVPAQGRI